MATFTPADGITKVQVSVAELTDDVIVEAGKFVTADDANVIDALRACAALVEVVGAKALKAAEKVAEDVDPLLDAAADVIDVASVIA